MKKVFLIFITLVIVFASCKSPMDIDTPRTITSLVKGRINTNLMQMTTDENGTPKYFIIQNASATLDTFGQVPCIWLNLNLITPFDSASYAGKLRLNSFSFNLDSFPINAPQYDFISDTINKFNPWIKFNFQRAANQKIANDTTIFCNNKFNFSQLSFSFDKNKKEVWVFLNTKIFSNDIWVEQHDTTIVGGGGIPITYPRYFIKQKPDSIIFSAKFKFQY